MQMNRRCGVDMVKRCRNQKPHVFLGSALTQTGSEQSGNRHRGGITLKQALLRNMRTCRTDVKGEAQVLTARGGSIDAVNRDRSTHSSGEVSVVEVERGACVFRLHPWLTSNGRSRMNREFHLRFCEKLGGSLLDHNYCVIAAIFCHNVFFHAPARWLGR